MDTMSIANNSGRAQSTFTYDEKWTLFITGATFFTILFISPNIFANDYHQTHESTVQQMGFVNYQHYQQSYEVCNTLLAGQSPHYTFEMIRKSSLWQSNLCDLAVAHENQTIQQSQQQEIDDLKAELDSLKKKKKKKNAPRTYWINGRFQTCYDYSIKVYCF